MKPICLGHEGCSSNFTADKFSVNGFCPSAIDTTVSAIQDHLANELGDLSRLSDAEFAILFVSCGPHLAKYIIGNTTISAHTSNGRLRSRREECNRRLYDALCGPNKEDQLTYVNKENGLCISISGTKDIESLNIPGLVARDLIRRWG